MKVIPRRRNTHSRTARIAYIYNDGFQAPWARAIELRKHTSPRDHEAARRGIEWTRELSWRSSAGCQVLNGTPGLAYVGTDFAHLG